jgi:hypothetical protein
MSAIAFTALNALTSARIFESLGELDSGDSGLHPTKPSPQLRVLGLGLLQDGDVGVGVFPQREEVLICRAGLGGLALKRIGAAQA